MKSEKSGLYGTHRLSINLKDNLESKIGQAQELIQ
jgi:hypothetical protein